MNAASPDQGRATNPAMRRIKRWCMQEKSAGPEVCTMKKRFSVPEVLPPTGTLATAIPLLVAAGPGTYKERTHGSDPEGGVGRYGQDMSSEAP